MSLNIIMLYELFFGHQKDTNNIKEPIVIKNIKDLPKSLEVLGELKSIAPQGKKELIEKEEYIIKQGLKGEKDILFELKNSSIPMLILNNIRIKIKDYYAQFDFIIITKKKIYVIKSKNLNGDITIRDDGQFVVTYKNKDGQTFKNSIFSPVSQNERNIALLKEFIKDKFKELDVEHFVVISNKNSIVNKKWAPKNVQDRVVKLDQFIGELKNDMNKNPNVKFLESTMNKVAEILLESNEELEPDYKGKFGIKDNVNSNMHVNKQVKKEESIVFEEIASTVAKVEESLQKSEESFYVKESSDDSEVNKILYNELKKVRLRYAKEEDVPAYIIFNNKTLDDLVEKKPKNKKELVKVYGISEVKSEKYGEEIIKTILNIL